MVYRVKRQDRAKVFVRHGNRNGAEWKGVFA
jgi:hypothetical protein